MHYIILDTDFLIKSMEMKADIIEFLDLNIGRPYSIIISGPVYYELGMIGKRKSKEGGYARVAKIFLEKINAEVMRTREKYGDKSIVELSERLKEKGKVYVGTLDRELIKKLREKGIHVITLKHMGRIELM